MPRKFINKKGQTLLIVIVALTVALILGLSIAVRLLSSTRRVTQTDTSQQAVSAAEAGIERFLILTPDQLQQADKDNESVVVCPPTMDRTQLSNGDWGCSFELPDPSSPDISTKAQVTVDDYVLNRGDYLGFDLDKGETYEVDINGYSSTNIDVCWNGDSHLYHMSYDINGNQDKSGTYCNTCAINPPDINGFDLPNPGIVKDGFARCTRLQLVGSPSDQRLGLRIRSLNGDSVVGVFPVSNNLPIQGYTITSYGSLADTESQIQITRTVTADVSKPFVTPPVEFAIFSNNGVLQ